MPYKKKNKIVFVNQSAGYITFDIINEFAKRYDKVALITGRLNVNFSALDPKIKISKVTGYKRGKIYQRLASWLFATFQIFILLIFKYRNYEIFYVSNPPIAYYISFVLSSKFSILIFDVYPDVLKIYDIKESSIIYNLWAEINKKIFAKAHVVFTICDSMANSLAEYVRRDKIEVIPLWSVFKNIVPVMKDDNFWIKENGFENKFIIQYSGNIGITHNVEVLIDIAKYIRKENDIIVVIIGEGDRISHIKNMVIQNKLDNCFILPFQPFDHLKFSLSAADLGVVILNEKASKVSLPSKLFNLQAVGVPLLGIASHDSEIGKHIENYGNGKCFDKSDIEGMCNYIIEIKNDNSLRNELSLNSLKSSGIFSAKNASMYYHCYKSKNF